MFLLQLHLQITFNNYLPPIFHVFLALSIVRIEVRYCGTGWQVELDSPVLLNQSEFRKEKMGQKCPQSAQYCKKK